MTEVEQQRSRADGSKAQSYALTTLRARYPDRWQALWTEERRFGNVPAARARTLADRRMRTSHEAEYRKLYRAKMDELDPQRVVERGERRAAKRAEIKRLRHKAREYLDRANALENELEDEW